MAKVQYSRSLKSRTSRKPLPAQKEPHWVALSPGFAIGYAKGARGSSWVAKWRDPESKVRITAKLPGVPDDAVEPDGVTVLTFEQAQLAAQAWREQQVRIARGDLVVSAAYSVKDVMADYVQHLKRAGHKPASIKKMQTAINTRILPTLGDVPLVKLRKEHLRTWFAELATAPLLRRPKANGERIVSMVDANDEDAVRARKATANRLLNILKAALNHALADDKITDAQAWKALKPYPLADVPKVQHLDAQSRQRLLNACQGNFRDLVLAALSTGCRYGELTNMKAGHFLPGNGGAIHVIESKSGKGRMVALNAEGVALFTRLTAGKKHNDLIFVRDDGGAWGPSHQKRRLEDANRVACIEPAATFHILRHTYASALAMQGVPMGVIAAQLGHADTRMTERHYAHFAPNYVADTVRAALPNMGGDAAVGDGVVVKFGSKA